MFSAIIRLGPCTHPEGLETAEDVGQSEADNEEEPESEGVLAAQSREKDANCKDLVST